MRYLLLIYGDESQYGGMSEEEMQADMGKWFAYTAGDAGRRRSTAGRGAAADGYRDDRPRATAASRSSPTGRSRRRRSSSAATTCSTCREPRRGDQVGARAPAISHGHDRAAADPGVRGRPLTARRPARRSGRALLPRRVRPRGRDPRPWLGRGRRPRRGSHPGRLCGRGRALAARGRPADARRVDPHHGEAPRLDRLRREAASAGEAGAAGSGPRGGRRGPARRRPRDDPRRAARAGLRLLPPGARPRGAGAADPAARRRADGAGDRPRPAARGGDRRPAARAREEEGAVSGIPIAEPPPDALPGRLGRCSPCSISSSTRAMRPPAATRSVRDELAAEAIRLARVVHALLPDEPEPAGLLALMLLHHARSAARAGERGELVLLAEQDRSRWDRQAIAAALPLVDHALTRPPPPARTRCRRRSPRPRPGCPAGGDRLGPDRRALRRAGAGPADAGGGAQPRGRGGDGRGAGGRAGVDRRRGGARSRAIT